MKKQNLSPKGKIKDGFYYKINCKSCGDQQGYCISKTLYCEKCDESEGVKLK